jgi:hypothetical protein
VEVHSSSSGAASGSDEEMSVTSSRSTPPNQHSKNRHHNQHGTINSTKTTQNQDHDYEDIYLVREEARSHGKHSGKPNSPGTRSRSRDSGSHSRSASASSTRSNNGDLLMLKNQPKFESKESMLIQKRNNLYEAGKTRYDIPRKPNDSQNNDSRKENKNNNHHSNHGNNILNNSKINNSNLNNASTMGNNSTKNRNESTYESVCSPEDLQERLQSAQRHSMSGANSTNSDGYSSRGGKRTGAGSSNTIAGDGRVNGPPPPPLPPPLKAPVHRLSANNNNVIEQTTDYFHYRHHIDENNNADIDLDDDSNDGPDSDSGLEVVEEPSLRPSDLVRGNHNRSMSIISGKLRFIYFFKNIVKYYSYNR